MEKQNSHKTAQPVPQVNKQHQGPDQNQLPTPPDLMLRLQRTVGNQALMRMLDDGVVVAQPAGPAITAGSDTIQRKSSTGLAESGLVKDFTKAALTYWRDATNKDKSFTDFADHLMADVNTKLKALGVSEVLHAYGSSGASRGWFSDATWTITINATLFSKRDGITTVGDLNQYEVSQVARTLYHEPRHAEQAFRIARMQAGEGKSAADIETDVGIPADVAAAAFADPLTGDSKANKELIAEAKTWEAFTVGKYADYMNDIYRLDDRADEMEEIVEDYDSSDPDKTYDALKSHVGKATVKVTNDLVPLLGKISAIKKKDSADRNVRRNVKAIKEAWETFKVEYNKDTRKIKKIESKLAKFKEATYTAYTELEHERDTRELHDAVIKSFNKQAKQKK